jgi:hypothetical protein
MLTGTNDDESSSRKLLTAALFGFAYRPCLLLGTKRTKTEPYAMSALDLSRHWVRAVIDGDPANPKWLSPRAKERR